MSFLDEITVLILTYNEEANIGRTLAAFEAFPRILVLDSGSTDRTAEIVGAHPGTSIIHHPFESFADQCNFGLSQITTEWVLSIDADYVLSPELVAEIMELAPSDEVSGYRARFVYDVFGRPLRGTLYPPRTVLYRKACARYRNEGHGHRVTVDGTVRDLRGLIHHDDRKPLSRWLSSQRRYAELEAAYLLSAPKSKLRATDRMRRIGWLMPLLVLPYTLIIKRCILDGWPGWYYALQRTLAEIMIALEILDRRLRRRAPEATEAHDGSPPIPSPDQRDAA